jgi:hypothetical protein
MRVGKLAVGGKMILTFYRPVELDKEQADELSRLFRQAGPRRMADHRRGLSAGARSSLAWPPVFRPSESSSTFIRILAVTHCRALLSVPLALPVPRISKKSVVVADCHEHFLLDGRTGRACGTRIVRIRQCHPAA